MARSSVKKNTRRTKDKQRNINVYSNPIIAKNWDKSLTLQQNYKRLGLRAKLGHMAGGVEKKVESLTELRNKKKNKDKDDIVTIDKIEHTDDPSKIPEGEARIIRDPETNEVLKVIYGTMKAEDEESDEDKVDNSVIKQLEEYAEQHSKVKKRGIFLIGKAIG